MAYNAPVKRTRHFASDNNAGICPEAWAALEQANAVFVDLPPVLVQALHARGWHFYTLYADNDARFMCAWDTTEEDVDTFAADLAALMANRKSLPPYKPPRGR